MKRFICIALLSISVVPAWSAARTITVSELRSMLDSMHRDQKSDADVAYALKQVQLSEELTPPVMASLMDDLPGTLSTEQIYVLEARSATLAPPPSDTPSAPAPDSAAQQTLLTKAETYAATTYGQLPALAVTRTTFRFQDTVEPLVKDAAPAPVSPYNYVHYIDSTDASIVLAHGAEQLPPDPTRWGPNRMIAVMIPDPDLAHVLEDVKAAGSVQWLRWERVSDKPVAVFSYSVPKKRSHLALNVCCFPDIRQDSILSIDDITMGRSNLATTQWSPFKAAGVPYHGELFIDPDSGIVVRMIVAAEQKPYEKVRREDTRVDYGPVTVGDKTMVLPVKRVVITEVSPTGQTGTGPFTTRSTLFVSTYKGYQAAAK